MDASGGSNREEQKLLVQMAKSGVPLLPWHVILPVIERSIVLRLQQAKMTQEERLQFNELVGRTLGMLRAHENAPFTIQRLCEILTSPFPRGATFATMQCAIQSLLKVTSTVPQGSEADVQRLEMEYRRFAPPPRPGGNSEDEEDDDDASGHTLTRTGTLDL